MGLLENLHRERKERMERLKKAAEAYKEAQKKPEPEIEIRGNDNRSKFDIVTDEVCAYYKVKKLDILSHRRFNFISTKRQILIYLLHSHTRMTHSQIAEKLDRDPSTVSYAVKKITLQYEFFREAIEAMRENLKKSVG